MPVVPVVPAVVPAVVVPAVTEKKPRKPRAPMEIHTLLFTTFGVTVYVLGFEDWFRQYARSEKPEVALRNWRKLTKVAHALNERFMLELGPIIEVLEDNFDPETVIAPQLRNLKKLAAADAKVKKERRAVKKAAKAAAAAAVTAAPVPAPALPDSPVPQPEEAETEEDEEDEEEDNKAQAHAALCEARHLLAVHVQDLGLLQANLEKTKKKNDKAVVQAAIDAKAALIEKAKADVAAAEAALA
jgi:hypothetical protein